MYWLVGRVALCRDGGIDGIHGRLTGLHGDIAAGGSDYGSRGGEDFALYI